MFFIAVCVIYVAAAVPVLSEAPPPPQNIHVDKWVMTWTPAATEERNVTYTVQYSSFDSNKWYNIPACIRISSNSCDVTSTKPKDELGCVRLRVRAERRGVKSNPVEACSRHGDSCTPEVDLTALPGSLTVHLSRNHNLAQEYADHAKYIVYYGREGEPLEEVYRDVSSVTIREVEVGQRYCVKVQYTVYDDPVGLPSCPQCVLIPESKNSTQTSLIVSMVVIFVVICLIIPMAYFIIYRPGKIKQLIKPPCKIPEDFLHLPELSPEHRHPMRVVEEPCEVISLMQPK